MGHAAPDSLEKEVLVPYRQPLWGAIMPLDVDSAADVHIVRATFYKGRSEQGGGDQSKKKKEKINAHQQLRAQAFA